MNELRMNDIKVIMKHNLW